MMQEILVFVIIAGAIAYVTFSVVKALQAPKKAGCSGCSGCALKDKANCSPISADKLKLAK